MTHKSDGPVRVTLQLTIIKDIEPLFRWKNWLCIHCIWGVRLQGKITQTKKASQYPHFTAVIYRKMQVRRESLSLFQKPQDAITNPFMGIRKFFAYSSCLPIVAILLHKEIQTKLLFTLLFRLIYNSVYIRTCIQWNGSN